MRNFGTAVRADPHVGTYEQDVILAATYLQWHTPEGRPMTLSSTGHFDAAGVGFANVTLGVSAAPSLAQ